MLMQQEREKAGVKYLTSKRGRSQIMLIVAHNYAGDLLQDG